MKAAITLAAVAIVLTLLPISARAQEGPPPGFLQTRVGAWNQILRTEITANFRNANIGAVTQFLAAQSGANIVVDVVPRKVYPVVTRKFHRVPLRTALYLISQDTGLEVDWVYAGKLPQLIRLR